MDPSIYNKFLAAISILRRIRHPAHRRLPRHWQQNSGIFSESALRSLLR